MPQFLSSTLANMAEKTHKLEEAKSHDHLHLEANF